MGERAKFNFLSAHPAGSQHQVAKRLSQRPMQVPRIIAAQLVHHDQFHDVRKVAMGAPEIAQAAGKFQLDESSKRYHR